MRHTRTFLGLKVVVALSALSWTGCGGGGGGGGNDDAGTAMDAAHADAGTTPRTDGGTAGDAGTTVRVDGGTGTDGGTSVDAGGPPTDAGPVDAAVLDGALPCGGNQYGACTGGQVCLRECCRPVGMCTWVARGSSCPWPLHPSTNTAVTCPPIPGVANDILCVDGECLGSSTYAYRCVDRPSGDDCTGSSCSLCGGMCTGGPPPDPARPPGVICRWIPTDAGPAPDAGP